MIWTFLRRTSDRPVGHSGCARAERLEPRTMLSSSLLAKYDYSNLVSHFVHDPTRSMLYGIRGDSVVRYDLLDAGRSGSWKVGKVLWGADITHDGAFLYVNERELTTDGKGVVHRVNLDDGSVSDLPYDVQGESGGGSLVVTSPQTAVLTAASGPLREIDLATGAITAVPNPPTYPNGFSGAGLTRIPARDAVIVGLPTYSSTSESHPIFIYEPAGDTFRAGDLGARGRMSAVSLDGSLAAMDMWFSGGPGAPVIDLNSGVTRRLPDGEIPMAFDPVRPLLYTLNNTGDDYRAEPDRISAFDTATLTKQFDFSLDLNLPRSGSSPPRATVAANGAQLFVLLEGGRDERYATVGTNLRAYALVPAPVISGFGTRPTPSSALQVASGKPVTLTVTVRDRAGNVVPDFAGTVAIHTNYSDPEFTPPAPLTFTPADKGVRTVTVTFPRPAFSGSARTLSLTAVDTATGAADSVVDFEIDGLAPQAVLPSTKPYSSPSGGLELRVTYTDDRGIDLATLGDDDLIVRTPRGAELPVRFVSHDLTDYVSSRSVVARYALDSADGRWDYTDNGSYDISVRPGAVVDAAGNAIAPAGAKGSFPVFEYGPGAQDDEESAPDITVFSPELAGLRDNRAYAGATITARVKVGNFAESLQKAGAYEFALLKDSEPVATLASGPVRLNLKPDAPAKAFNVRVRIPAETAAGIYRLQASFSTKPYNDVGPLDNTSESFNFEVVQKAGPLTMRLPALRRSLTPGRAETITLWLRNDNAMAVQGRYELRLLATSDGTAATELARLATSTKSMSLKPGQEKAVTFRFAPSNVLAAGEYQLLVAAQPAAGKP